MRGLDDAFLAHTTYGLAAIAPGYGSAGRRLAGAARRGPDLAVVDAIVAPRRDNFGFGVLPDFQLTGFYLEDGRFAPVPVDVRDPQTGQRIRLTVIGVLADTAPLEMAGISTSQRTLAAALGRPARRRPSTGFDLAPGADPGARARRSSPPSSPTASRPRRSRRRSRTPSPHA